MNQPQRTQSTRIQAQRPPAKRRRPHVARRARRTAGVIASSSMLGLTGYLWATAAGAQATPTVDDQAGQSTDAAPTTNPSVDTGEISDLGTLIDGTDTSSTGSSGEASATNDTTVAATPTVVSAPVSAVPTQNVDVSTGPSQSSTHGS